MALDKIDGSLSIKRIKSEVNYANEATNEWNTNIDL